MRLGIAFAALVLAPGCAGSEDVALTCADPLGGYDAVYVMRDGSCDASTPSLVPHVTLSQAGTAVGFIQRLPTHKVYMGNEVDGCHVHLLLQAVELSGDVIADIEGDATARSDGTIHGVVEVSLVDAEYRPTCTSRYDVTLTPGADPNDTVQP